MTNYYAFRISKRCQTRRDFLEVPHLVIPNLFRDLGVDLIQGRVHDLGRAKDGSFQGKTVHFFGEQLSTSQKRTYGMFTSLTGKESV